MPRRAKSAGARTKKVKIGDLIDLSKYMVPENVTVSAINDFIFEPAKFSIPMTSDVIERLREAAFPVDEDALLGNLQNGQLELEAPERRVPQIAEIIQEREIEENDGPQTCDASPYSNAFLYEAVHHIFYCKTESRYLPFFGTTPNRKWIINMLQGYDPTDLLTLRVQFNPDQVMDHLERVGIADANAVNQQHPGFLRLPVAGDQNAFMDSLNHLLSKTQQMRGEGKTTVKSVIRSMLVALNNMSLTVNEGDFRMTQIYTHLLEIERKVSEKARSLFYSGNQVDTLPGHLYSSVSEQCQTLLRRIPSKGTAERNYVQINEADLLLELCPEAHRALKYCLGGTREMPTFEVELQPVNKDRFLRYYMRQDSLGIGLCSSSSTLDGRLRYCVEGQFELDDVMNLVGILNRDTFRDFCNRIRQSIVERRVGYLEALGRYIDTLGPEDYPLKDHPGFIFSDIVRLCFCRMYAQ